jgi:OHCU decarboxylase
LSELTLDSLNALPPDDAEAKFLGCCGTRWWARQMTACRPFASLDQLHDTADAIFNQMAEGHWLEAFAAHPKIGDVDSLRMKFAGNRQWSAGEQAGLDAADERTIQQLAHGNMVYEERFGYIFIVCASGLTADQMLGMLKRRLKNDPAAEAAIACGEQQKITHRRLDKMVG